MQLFYDPGVSAGTHQLREEEAVHAGRVLRKRAGDTLDLVDGKGGWFRGEITSISKRECQLQVIPLRQEVSRSNHRLQLLVAPTKNIDRFEWILEKATEIGVDVIQPIFTEHSERKRIRTDRLQRVVESAMKQSLRAWMPLLADPVTLSDALENYRQAPGYLAYLGEEKAPLLKDAYVRTGDATIVIGPEGGFSAAEAAAARALNYQFVSLGPHRLRTETAAIAAVHAIEMLNW